MRLVLTTSLRWGREALGPTHEKAQNPYHADDGLDIPMEGPLLPTSGRFSFSVRIERSKINDGDMFIGVCTEASTCGPAGLGDSRFAPRPRPPAST